MQIVLCTDDPVFATVVPHLLDGTTVRVFPVNELTGALHFSEVCSYLIIGLPLLTAEEWGLLDVIKIPSIPTFVMARREITPEDHERAEQIGLHGILVDPLAKLRGNDAGDPQAIFDRLVHQLSKDDLEMTRLVFLGCDTYFHPEQHWILRCGERTILSDREAGVLNLFIRYEGKIVTKDTLAKELWNGRVVRGGIPKLVGRLKDKMGVAAGLIQGRKQGGYVYDRGTMKKVDTGA